jgi:hypothetical protein
VASGLGWRPLNARPSRCIGVKRGAGTCVFGGSVCVSPPMGAKLSGARNGRNVGVSAFHRNFGCPPVILPAGRSRAEAGTRDGA